MVKPAFQVVVGWECVILSFPYNITLRPGNVIMTIKVMFFLPGNRPGSGQGCHFLRARRAHGYGHPAGKGIKTSANIDRTAGRDGRISVTGQQ